MNPRVKSKKDGKLLVFAREDGTCYEEVSIFNNAVDKSESQRQSLSLSLSLVFFFFVSYTCLHCCFLEMVCLFLFALRCCCCSCPIPFLQKLIEEMKHIYYFDSPFCSYREEAIKRIVEIIFIGMAGKLCESSE
jgi:hypothetical protein